MKSWIHKTDGKEVFFLPLAWCGSGCKLPTLEEEVLILCLRRCEFNYL